jgi:transposase InsO family protein
MVVSGEQSHRWIIHDRDGIYSEGVDATLTAMGLTILKTPVRAPQANAYCERLIGTIRRECLDWVIPLNEQHVRRVLVEWSLITTTDARMRVWDLASRIRRARRPASVHLIVACRSALESSRSRCWAGCITSTDWHSLHETGNGISRRLFCGSQP